MQRVIKSFRLQLLTGMILFSFFAVLISLILVISTDRIYKKRMMSEIDSLTEIVTQSIDHNFYIPVSYLKGIKTYFNEHHELGQSSDEPCFISDMIEYTQTFEAIALVNEKGKVSDMWPFEENFLGIDITNQPFYKKNLAPDEVYWSGSFLSLISGAPTIAMSTKCDAGILIAFYNMKQLDQYISIQVEYESDFIAILDSRGNIVTQSRNSDKLIGNLNNLPAIKDSIRGYYGTSINYLFNKKGLVSVKKADISGYMILVFKDYDLMYRKIYIVTTSLLLSIIFIAAVFTTIALLIIRRFFLPLSEFQVSMSSAASGKYDQMKPAAYREFQSLADSFSKMIIKIQSRETSLNEAISERETLLSELNHRTKNNMQMIIALMQLYESQYPDADPQQILKKIKSKIESIALVHENFYNSAELSHINFKSYITELVPILIYSFTPPAKQIEYHIESEELQLLIDYAIPLGLVINELTMNSLKYAFDEIDNGLIEIEVKICAENTLEVRYRDNGPGLAAGFDIETTESLGLSIINNLVTSQLNGNLLFPDDAHFSCTIRIKLGTYNQRI